MGDWSILGRFLTEVQNHSTVIGKIWLTMLLIFRILLVALVGDAVYSDEQSKFTCNTLQPGCSNVCYDTFAPVSHLRFWVFQIVLVSTPSIFYVIYVLHKIAKDEEHKIESKDKVHEAATLETDHEEALEVKTPTLLAQSEEVWGPQEVEGLDQTLLAEDFGEVAKDPTELSSHVLLTYIVHVVLRSIMELVFLVGQCCLFGFEVPYLFQCDTYPCPNRTDCFVSRATEKTIFLNFMFSIGLGCFLLNVVELHYLGWVYVFRIICLACSTCCEPDEDPNLVQRLQALYANPKPLLLQLTHSLRGHLLLHPSLPVTLESCPVAAHETSISFEADSTVEYMRGPDNKERAKLGRCKKAWL
ncbi:gap junction delta-2 protein-like [Colossoma macropomum]|uniref:gap junction delta-2 protein-like n=1 Tax=Colossoma macropomum TaxID=42526 RepID=UPI001864101E|nr:gap junction delta-2 protein-like [Colossoma macropomum]